MFTICVSYWSDYCYTDIDECREGTHLCDEFQNCINTYGAHECRCKNGFELDSLLESCVGKSKFKSAFVNKGPSIHVHL